MVFFIYFPLLKTPLRNILTPLSTQCWSAKRKPHRPGFEALPGTRDRHRYVLGHDAEGLGPPALRGRCAHLHRSDWQRQTTEARTEVKRILAEKALGKVRPLHRTFDNAEELYLAECRQKNRPRTVEGYKKLLDRHSPFGRRSIGDITPRDIQGELGKLAATPGQRHHAFTAGRAFFRWCVGQHLIERSPMEHVRVPLVRTPRERVLSQDELKAVYTSARAGMTPFHRIVALLVLTGQRRGEIAALQWSWIKENTITLPRSHTQNRREHTFPIGPAAKDVLKSIPRLKDNPYIFPAARDKVKGKPAPVFNGWGKPKAAFDAECGVSNWTLHDLRRTFSSGVAALGVPQVVVEKLLNHISGGT